MESTIIKVIECEPSPRTEFLSPLMGRILHFFFRDDMEFKTIVILVAGVLQLPLPLDADYIDPISHGCRRKYFGAYPTASSSWWGWEPKYALRGLTWSSATVALHDYDDNHECSPTTLSPECPQFFEVEFAKPTRARYVEFGAYNGPSALTSFTVLAAKKADNKNNKRSVGEIWTVLLEVEKNDTPRRRTRRELGRKRYEFVAGKYDKIKIEIRKIEASRNRKKYWASITDLIIC